jgi:MFS family permease
VPVGILAFFMISTFMPHIASDNKNQKIDYLGAGLLAGGLSSLMLALVWGGNQYAWTSWQVSGMATISAALLALFARVEKKHAKDPILPLELFQNSIFRVSMLIVFLVGMAMFGAILYVPLFAQEVLGRSATNSGIITMPMVLSLVFTSIITGQIVSRTGKYKKVAIVGMGAVMVAMFWFSTMGIHTTSAQMAIRLILAGLGLGISMPIFNLIVQNAFDHSKLGVATSSVQLSRQIGATVGVAIMGSVLNNGLAKHLGSLANEPSTQQLAANTGKSLDVSHVNSNQLQTLLSPQAQHAATSQIANLPPEKQHGILAAYEHFINGLKTALSSSISEVFIIAGSLMVIAFIASWFLKEIPLRTSNDHKDHPLVTEGGAPGGTPS